MTRSNLTSFLSAVLVGGIVLVAVLGRVEAKTTKTEVTTITCPKTVDITIATPAKAGFGAATRSFVLTSPQSIDTSGGLGCAYLIGKGEPLDIEIIHPFVKGAQCALDSNGKLICKSQ